MRIGFDGTCLANRRGFGRFSRLLLDALARHAPRDLELVVFLDRPSAGSVTLPGGVHPAIVELDRAPAEAASASGRRRIKDMLAMSRAVARAKLDVMYFPATYTFFPVWNVPRLVVTMHDTLALAHPDLVFPTRGGRLAWLLKEHVAARTADRIVTVSETSRRDLQSWFGLPADRLRVVTEGPAPVFRPQGNRLASELVLDRYGIPADSRYFVYVGGLSPHKNLPRLVEAFARVAGPGVLLVIVGDFGDVFHTDVASIRVAIDRHGLSANVILPGFVPDEDLVHLYSRAMAVVQPSLMEGFGLPPVEAMACGVPVAASRAGSLPEIVGDAGLLFDPTDIESIADALRSIRDDSPLRERLAALALDRSRRFSWDLAARQLLDCFLEFVPDDGRRSGDGRKAG
ncbi:glycosyltransferase family 4 protein [Aquisphaera insulae]|uniref:glycosyltransferase family 4 protein n=1 Tax=Aquisphaera insulae TaxID=2712864 RepID=UPI0013EA1F57|nr:glycosyltransferase family 1 protein [Aquisphaera insulae]